MNLYLRNGVKDPHNDEEPDRVIGPVLSGIDSVSWVDDSPRFHMSSPIAAREAAHRFDWALLDPHTIGQDPFGGGLAVRLGGEDVLYYLDWEVSEPSDKFQFKVAELAAAIMHGLCHVDADGNSVYEELYRLSDSGMVGPWVCCAEIAVEAERRYGAEWESGERSFLDDTDWLPFSLMQAAREFGKQPQGEVEIHRVFEIGETPKPTTEDVRQD